MKAVDRLFPHGESRTGKALESALVRAQTEQYTLFKSAVILTTLRDRFLLDDAMDLARFVSEVLDTMQPELDQANLVVDELMRIGGDAARAGEAVRKAAIESTFRDHHDDVVKSLVVRIKIGINQAQIARIVAAGA